MGSFATLSTAMLHTIARGVDQLRPNEHRYTPRHLRRGPVAEKTRPLPVRGVAHVPAPRFVRAGGNAGRHAATR